MSEKDVIEMLERFAAEYPDGFSADVLGVINNLKAEIEELKVELEAVRGADYKYYGEKMKTKDKEEK